MGKVYGMKHLDRLIESATSAVVKKGLEGEKEILLMLEAHLPRHVFIIHNPTLLQYEADILVMEETIGFMFLEVKTWSENYIERFYPNGSIQTIKGMQKPLKQAENYRDELKKILSSDRGDVATQDPHQLISSVVVFNGISKEQFLHRQEVLDWEEELKNTFLTKHYFYAEESRGFYSWMLDAKKFTRSSVSNYFSKESFDRLIEVLVHDHDVNKNVIENKAPTIVRKSQQQTLANINALVSEHQRMILQESPALKVKKKRKLGILFGVLAIGIGAVGYILNDWRSGEESYVWQEDSAPGSQVFMDVNDDGSPQVTQGAYDYYILADSEFSELSETQLYGLSKSDLRLARNEVYARHGYVFESADLQAYFDSQMWYVADETYDGELTDVERNNVTLIHSLE
ncbi:YARHG domain-containing protein [Sporosarcina ureae]|uniref:YARHG domain-containing protein n=1 Tax=Sporosarcina ureae TaxID=1571 RepID=A0ABN4YS86_SPOUR|nr:YARHG domain-containing protein [Sporosarcina ureae]ARF14913.1 hypothetical protein SporoS204_12570 [Sporosarcina ureae]